MSLRISIVTINFQNCNNLKLTINSVLNQSYKNIEYIIIDGGSSDGSKEYIETISNKLYYWESENDNGIYHAMNKGWKKATGEYCLFLNSGDYLYNDNVINEVVENIKKSNSDIVFGDLYTFDEHRSWVSYFKEPISLYYFHHSFLPHPATFTRLSLLQKLNGFYENYSVLSDWAFFVRALLANASFTRIDLIVTSFYMKGASSDSTSGQLDKEKLFNNEFKFLAEDFKNFDRLRHFDTSSITKLARSISTLKIKYFG